VQPLRVLLDKEANPLLVDSSKRLALHAAAGGGRSEVVEILFEKTQKHPHSPEDENGWTPLHLACFANSPATVAVLLSKQARLESRGMRATTPLMLCCADDSASCALLLLKAGADANALNRDGRTSLFEAVINRSLPVCKYLIEHDVNVNRLDECDEVAIHEALDWDEGFMLLLENESDPNCALDGGTTLLFEMAKRGKIDAVKLLRKRGALLEAASVDHRQTALHVACEKGHLEVVKFLLEEGAGVNNADYKGRTPLHLACSSGSASVVEVLLQKESEVKKDGTRNTPLHLAASKGFEKCVALLMKHQKESGGLLEIKNGEGKTALMLAAEANSYSCVTSLLEGCPDSVVMAKDESGRTALHYSLKAGDVDSSTSLIWAGCSCSEPDNDDVRPYHLASRLGKKKLLVEMVEKETPDPAWTDKSGRNVIHYVSAGGSEEALQIMLDLLGDGGDNKEQTLKLLNAKDSHGTTSLHFACEFNYAGLVKMMLDEGADIHSRNDAGLYPVHTAAKKGKQSLEEILKVSKDSDLSIDVCDSEQLTPLLVACLHGNLAAAALLVENGANINVKDSDAMTPVHAAVESGDELLIKYLCEQKGIEVRGVDATGAEPIHLACTNGNAGCLEALILSAAGIDLNAYDSKHRTPLILACEGGHKNCVKKLVANANVLVNMTNDHQQGAAHISSLNGKLDCLKVLMTREDLDLKAVDDQERSILHNVVLFDDVSLTKKMLEVVGVNAITKQLVTPLHEAAVRGSLRSAKMLLDNGADVSAKALQGLSSLHNASSFKNDDMIQLLVKNGADVNAKSDRGLTPLMCSAGKLRIVFFFFLSLSYFLFFTIAMGHARTCVLLVKLGADVEMVDQFGDTALHKAANSGSGSAVTVLIERGSEVGAENDKGETAYIKALRKGHRRVAQTLEDNA
jgi:ankyrin repeat protein